MSLSRLRDVAKTSPASLDDFSGLRSIRTSPSADAVSIPVTPHQYQLELFEKAKQRNLIVVLDTGAGKTLISALLVKAYCTACLNVPIAHRSLVIFAVPNVHLVAQQAAVLSKVSGQPVAMCSGAHTPGLLSRGRDGFTWNGSQWDTLLQQYRVFVVTPQVLLDALRHGFLSLATVSLLIMDECHHTTGNHPYNVLMREFYFMLPSPSRPRVFGMTASPCKVKNPADLAEEIQKLEFNLDAKMETSVLFAEEHTGLADRPAERVVFFSAAPYLAAEFSWCGALLALRMLLSVGPDHEFSARLRLMMLQDSYLSLLPVDFQDISNNIDDHVSDDSMSLDAFDRDHAWNESSSKFFVINIQKLWKVIRHVDHAYRSLGKFCAYWILRRAWRRIKGRLVKFSMSAEHLKIRNPSRFEQLFPGHNGRDSTIEGNSLFEQPCDDDGFESWTAERQCRYLCVDEQVLLRFFFLMFHWFFFSSQDMKCVSFQCRIAQIAASVKEDVAFGESQSELVNGLSLTDELSPKTAVLVSILLEAYKTPLITGAAFSFSSMVFVERKSAAFALSGLVNCLFSELHSKTADPAAHDDGFQRSIFAAPCVGHSSMKSGLQSLTVKVFRDGAIPILFATQVGEEGLDFGSCSLVIRMDMFHTLMEYIQSRGRARSPNSVFVILAENGSAACASHIAHIRHMENTMRAQIVSRSECSTTGPLSLSTQIPFGSEAMRWDCMPRAFFAYMKGRFECGVDDSVVYRVPSTDARISLLASVPLVHQFFSRLARQSPFVSMFPEQKTITSFDDVSHVSLYQVQLRLSGRITQLVSDSTFHLISSPFCVRKERAKAFACLFLCGLLHSAHLIDDFLCPLDFVADPDFADDAVSEDEEDVRVLRRHHLDQSLPELHLLTDHLKDASRAPIGVLKSVASFALFDPARRHHPGVKESILVEEVVSLRRMRKKILNENMDKSIVSGHLNTQYAVGSAKRRRSSRHASFAEKHVICGLSASTLLSAFTNHVYLHKLTFVSEHHMIECPFGILLPFAFPPFLFGQYLGIMMNHAGESGQVVWGVPIKLEELYPELYNDGGEKCRALLIRLHEIVLRFVQNMSIPFDDDTASFSSFLGHLADSWGSSLFPTEQSTCSDEGRFGVVDMHHSRAPCLILLFPLDVSLRSELLSCRKTCISAQSFLSQRGSVEFAPFLGVDSVSGAPLLVSHLSEESSYSDRYPVQKRAHTFADYYDSLPAHCFPGGYKPPLKEGGHLLSVQSVPSVKNTLHRFWSTDKVSEVCRSSGGDCPSDAQYEQDDAAQDFRAIRFRRRSRLAFAELVLKLSIPVASYDMWFRRCSEIIWRCYQRVLCVETLRMLKVVPQTSDTDVRRVSALAFLFAGSLKSSNDGIDYERLEFLGDSILKLLSSVHLYCKYGHHQSQKTSFANANEGALSEIRESLISNLSLSRLAVQAGLHNRLFSSPVALQKFIQHVCMKSCNWSHSTNASSSNSDVFATPENTPIAVTEKRLADVVEALIGSVFVNTFLHNAEYDGDRVEFALMTSTNLLHALGHPISPQYVCSAYDLELPAVCSMCMLPPMFLSALEDAKVALSVCYEFRRPMLLMEALTHPSSVLLLRDSYPSFQNVFDFEIRSYERFEFLGDAVLDSFVAQSLWFRDIGASPGDLTFARSLITSNHSLARRCVKLGLSRCVVVDSETLKQSILSFEADVLRMQTLLDSSVDEELWNLSLHLRTTKVSRRSVASEADIAALMFEEGPKVLADVFEAVVAAVWLDTDRDFRRTWSVLGVMLGPAFERLLEDVRSFVNPP
eukprot:ANDGO_06531.mRNA.1 Endoribonuclease Dicer homolog 3b